MPSKWMERRKQQWIVLAAAAGMGPMVGSVWAASHTTFVPANDTFSFGRVAQGATAVANVNNITIGGNGQATSTTTTESDAGITAPNIASNVNGAFTLGVTLNNVALGSGTVGTKNWTITLAGDLASGSATTIGGSATIVANRSITQAAPNPVVLGAVFVNNNTSSTNATLSSTGLNSATANVTVNGGTFSPVSGTTLVVGNTAFAGAASSESKAVSMVGKFTSAGAKSGSVTLSSANGGLSGESGVTGQTVSNVTIAYSATAYDHGQAQVNGGSTINLGRFTQGSGTKTLSYNVTNLQQTAGFTGMIDITGVTGSATGFSSGISATSDLAAGSSAAFNASFDTSNTAAGTGVKTVNYSLQTRDANSQGIGGGGTLANVGFSASVTIDAISELVSTNTGINAARTSLGTVAPVHQGGQYYVAGTLTNINGGAGASRGSVTINMGAAQGQTADFGANDAVLLFDFNTTTGLSALAADLSAFGYNANTTGGLLSGEYAGYDLQITLPGITGSTSYFDYDFSNYDGGNLKAVNIAVVPEPTTFGLIALAGSALLARRRRKA